MSILSCERTLRKTIDQSEIFEQCAWIPFSLRDPARPAADRSRRDADRDVAGRGGAGPLRGTRFDSVTIASYLISVWRREQGEEWGGDGDRGRAVQQGNSPDSIWLNQAFNGACQVGVNGVAGRGVVRRGAATAWLGVQHLTVHCSS